MPACLSTAVAKEIYIRNRRIDANIADGSTLFAGNPEVWNSYKGLAKTRYVNDKQITDHYAIIPTGQGTSGT